MKMKQPSFVLALILSLLFGGCRSTSSTQATPPAQTSVDVPGAITKGVVVTRFTGHALDYRKKCESCGFVSPQTTGTAVPEAPWTCQVTFACPKCGKTTEGFIKRTR